LKLTVVELPDSLVEFETAWAALVQHVRAAASDIVLLSEVPFAPWFATSPTFVDAAWREVCAAHVQWATRLEELSGAAVVYTSPVGTGESRRNRGMLWTAERGESHLRDKVLLPDEDPTWEASWYGRGVDPPAPFDVAGAAAGLLICSEVWSLEWASDLGRAGAQLLLTPRATGLESLANWFAVGRVAAISSGTFSLSSNRVGDGFGGGGWVFAPDGSLLGRTSTDAPFVTVTIDLGDADRAKSTYPRYVTWRRPAPSRGAAAQPPTIP